MSCKKKTQQIDQLARIISGFDGIFTAKKDGRTHIIQLKDVYYFDNVDDRVYCYTHDSVLETGYRLYEIENDFAGSNLLRISKNMIVDVSKISSFKAQLNGRMDAVLKNGERVEISRNYVAALKQKLLGLNPGKRGKS